MKAQLVQATYVSSVIENLPQQSGVIDVSLVFALTQADQLCARKWQ